MDEALILALIAQIAALYPPLITFDEAMVIARHKTKGTLYDWSARGLLQKFQSKRGRNVRLGRDEFVRFLCEHLKKPPTKN